VTTGAVLIVEDSDHQRDMMVRCLSAQGHRATAVASGEEALSYLDRRDLDLVVTDFKMPGMNGLELARRSLAADPDRPVILATAFADVDNARQAISLGLYDFITKPFDVADLGNAVQRALNHRRLTLENRAYQRNLELMVEERMGELQEALTRLQQSEERYRMLAENIQEVFWMADQRKPEMIYVSPAYEEVWGRTCRSLYEQPRSFLEAVHPEDRERVMASLERQSRGESTEEEYRIVRPDGSVRWIYDQGFPIRDETGQVYRVAGIAEDITERKRAGEIFRIRTEQLAAVTDAMLAFLENGNWQAASAKLLRGALDLTESEYGFVGVVAEGPVLRILAHEGVAWDTAINREFYENALKTYREAGYLEFTGFKNLFGEVITTGKTVISNDPASAPRSGGLPPGHPPMRSFLGVPVLRGAEVVGMIGVANRPGGYTHSDETNLEVLSHATGVLYESYRQQEREAALERQLYQAQKMEAVGTLAGGVAHDFNNVLTCIIGFAQMALFEDGASSQWREYVAKIPEQGRRAAKLISQLLTFSRQAVTERQPLVLLPLVKETAKMLERTVPENISIRLNAPGDVWTVNADPTQMQQVLLNLCVNAGHAMPEGGELTLGLENVTLDEAYCRQYACAKSGDYVCLSVRDTGIGMTPEVQARIFEPFFTTKEVGRGTGLGLAMVYGIVKEHGGHVNVYSEVGKGSEFKVYLPAMAAKKAHQVASAEESPPGGAETLLLVEDDDVVLMAGQRMLELLGYTVLTARDGREAIEVHRAYPGEIALVLTDLVMPNMGGRELFEALRQADPEAKVLLMSGYGPQKDLTEMRARGLKGFVQKPLDFAGLGRAVRRALDE
jgi:PAS domain S-box-containing protein